MSQNRNDKKTLKRIDVYEKHLGRKKYYQLKYLKLGHMTYFLLIVCIDYVLFVFAKYCEIRKYVKKYYKKV